MRGCHIRYISRTSGPLSPTSIHSTPDWLIQYVLIRTIYFIKLNSLVIPSHLFGAILLKTVANMIDDDTEINAVVIKIRLRDSGVIALLPSMVTSVPRRFKN